MRVLPKDISAAVSRPPVSLPARAKRLALLALVGLFGTASTAEATWQLYGSGDIGYSIGIATISGTSNFTGADLRGKDMNVSPLMAGAFGLQVPMDELTPWRLPRDWRLPDWPLRFEVEFAGLREYDFETPGQTPGTPGDLPFHTNVKSWSMLNNVWFDIPLEGLHRPLESITRLLSRRERAPRLRRVFRPATFYFGAGIGFSEQTLKTSDAVIFGNSKSIQFAYQAGAGFGYQLRDRVNLGVGYRFFQPGKVNLFLRDTGLVQGAFGLDSDIHEVRFSMRILLYDLPYPWR